MSTEIHNDVQLDLQAICDALAAGKTLDPVLIKRVQERAEVVRREIRAKHGILDVAVELIREVRDE